MFSVCVETVRGGLGVFLSSLSVLCNHPDSCWVETVSETGSLCVCTLWSEADQVVSCISPP